jgi:hypothetical protein
MHHKSLSLCLSCTQYLHRTTRAHYYLICYLSFIKKTGINWDQKKKKTKLEASLYFNM